MLLKCLVIHHIQHTCLTYTLAVTHDDAQDGSHTFTFTYTPTAHPSTHPHSRACTHVCPYGVAVPVDEQDPSVALPP